MKSHCWFCRAIYGTARINTILSCQKGKKVFIWAALVHANVLTVLYSRRLYSIVHKRGKFNLSCFTVTWQYSEKVFIWAVGYSARAKNNVLPKEIEERQEPTRTNFTVTGAPITVQDQRTTSFTALFFYSFCPSTAAPCLSRFSLLLDHFWTINRRGSRYCGRKLPL